MCHRKDMPLFIIVALAALTFGSQAPGRAQTSPPSTVIVSAMGTSSVLSVNWDRATAANSVQYAIRGSAVTLAASKVVGLDTSFGFVHAHVTASGIANGAAVVVEIDVWLTKSNNTGTAKFTLAFQSNPSRVLFDSGYMSASRVYLTQ